ncbi:hypothetical protein TH63_16210 [Rufibacter radiotolerans]|uniref:DUF304 domain-containing protein n=1 Tax=Rufibacter radiotolerans TaxID=1379910 RepID=A0A0H4VLX2_9BACT|nr:hypothetical protein [Rufibacter radiotolerans]AKQ46820.1 hypothetical protein TH63_16210 [Rufibacter radiotolerans]
METFFLNLSPSKQNASTISWLYLFMALVFLVVGGVGVYKQYTAEETVLSVYFLPLLQLALAIAYGIVAWRRSKPAGKRYVQVTEDHLELKLQPRQAPLTLLWSEISLLRVLPDRLMYRLVSGQGGEVTFDSIPEEYEDTVREAIRQAGKRKGVSL